MRYSERAILKLVDKNEYDYETGEHVYKELYSDIVACFTMDLGLGKSVQIFGDYNKQRKVIFLKNAYNKPFNVVEYRGKRYIPTADKQLSKAFYLERDDSDGTEDTWHKKIKD